MDHLYQQCMWSVPLWASALGLMGHCFWGGGGGKGLWITYRHHAFTMHFISLPSYLPLPCPCSGNMGMLNIDVKIECDVCFDMSHLCSTCAMF